MGYHKDEEQRKEEQRRNFSEDSIEILEKVLSIIELVLEGEISQLESEEHELFSKLLPIMGLVERACEEAACTNVSVLTDKEISELDLHENPYFCSDECTARALGLDQE